MSLTATINVHSIALTKPYTHSYVMDYFRRSTPRPRRLTQNEVALFARRRHRRGWP